MFLKFFKRREKSKTLGEGKYFRGGEGKKGKYLVSEGEEKVGKYLVSKGEEEQRMKRRKISYRRQDCCGTDGWTDIDGKCRPKAVQGRIVIWQLLKERVFSVTTSLSINFQNILI